MSTLSTARKDVPILAGLTLEARGKVRDTYSIPNREDCLLVVTSDGISIFDFVLNALIPQKGQILTAMSHFWLTRLAEFGIRTHLIAAGSAIDQYLPESLRGNTELQSRAMVVRKLKMIPIEFIARGFLTGSGLKSYQEGGAICGHVLPPGLQDGDELPRILDTPTTKASEGHDEAVDALSVRRLYPEETYCLLQVFQLISWHARQKGVIFADTKLEFGRTPDGVTWLGDEVGTGDSSRWWDVLMWTESRKAPTGRKAPPPYDKQLVRGWGIKQGVNGLDPRNQADAQKVEQLVLPPVLIKAATETYRYIFWRLTGTILEEYLAAQLAVQLPLPKKRVAVVLGSESDLPAIKEICDSATKVRGQISQIDLHVISCHRNPEELIKFVNDNCGGADVVVAAGGKALALPGVLDAHLYHAGKQIPVVGVALGTPGTRAFEAARLSIEELPGQPVIMDELDGAVYCEPEGFKKTLDRLNLGELPPPKPRVQKAARLFL